MTTLADVARHLADAVAEGEELAAKLAVESLNLTLRRVWLAATEPHRFAVTAAVDDGLRGNRTREQRDRDNALTRERRARQRAERAGRPPPVDVTALRPVAAWKVPDDVSAIVAELFREGGVTAVVSYATSAKREMAEGLGGQVFDPVVAEYMSTASNRLVRIGQVAWEAARAQLERSLRDGTPREEMKAVLQEVLRVSEYRADMIVRTETNMAANAGVAAMGRLMAEAGLSVEKQWFANHDHRTRPSHVIADGQTQPLSEPFEVGPPDGPMSLLMFPGDPHGPPEEVIQCRCTHLIIETAAEKVTPEPEPEPVVTGGPRPGMGDIPIDPAEFGSGPVKSDSALRFFDPATGKFSPDRQALHDRIVKQLVDGHARQENPELVMLGGGPAVGKSSTLLPSIRQPDDAVELNADLVKELLRDGDAYGAEDWAAMYHEESSYIVKRAMAAAQEQRMNVLLDGTGDGGVEALRRKIAAAHEAGYRVRGEYATIDTAEAIKRSAKRAKLEGRTVPTDVIVMTHRKVSEALVANMDQFDEVRLWDTTGRTARLIATGGRDLRFHVSYRAGWARFQAKADPLDYDRQVIAEAMAKPQVRGLMGAKRTGTLELAPDKAALAAEARIREVGKEIDDAVQARLPNTAKLGEQREAVYVRLRAAEDAAHARFLQQANAIAREAGYKDYQDYGYSPGRRDKNIVDFRQEIRALDPTYRKLSREQTQLEREANEITVRWRAGLGSGTYAKALIEELEKRGVAMGQPPQGYTQTLHNFKKMAGMQLVKPPPDAAGYARGSDTALANYPRSWNEASNAKFGKRGGMFVGDIDGSNRGFESSTFSAEWSVIHIPKSRIKDVGLYVHEWGHRFQDSLPTLRNAEWVFLMRRSAGGKVVPLRDLTGNRNYRPNEEAVEGGFANPYAGKIYGSMGANTEVVTMGMEGIWKGTQDLTGDDDYRHFIIGLLALIA